MFVQKAYAAIDISTEYAPASALGGEKATLSTLINPIIANVFIISGIAALVVILLAGFSFISANGDKAKTAQSSQMLTYGIIGLVVVIAAFLLTRLFGSIFGFTFL